MTKKKNMAEASSTLSSMTQKATDKELEVFMRPKNAEGACDVITDALQYFRNAGKFAGILAIYPTDKSAGSCGIYAIFGTELDVATSVVYAMSECEDIKNIVIKTGTLMAGSGMNTKRILAKPRPRRIEMSKRVYISGPISGYDVSERKEAFSSAARRFRKQGYLVVNPFELGVSDTASWSEHMRADIAALMQCDVIYMLRGWSSSTGASIERNLAEIVGIKVMLEDSHEMAKESVRY